MFAIETKNLTKKYKNITALDSLNLCIKKGEVFGLLGPNGAGKTTAISILCTMINPTSGQGFVNGIDVVQHPSKVRQQIGLVFQDPSLDDRLTGRENLEIHAWLYSIPSKQRKQRIEEILDLIELKERADNLVKTYSGGMKRRLELGRGLLHNPKTLFLDEPTIGLDPQTREHIWTYLEQLIKQQELTVILTTHYMEEADRLCTLVGIIDSGKIKVIDTTNNLKSQLKGDTITLKSPELNKLLAIIQAQNPEPRTQNSEPRTQNPDSQHSGTEKIANCELGITNEKSTNRKSTIDNCPPSAISHQPSAVRTNNQQLTTNNHLQTSTFIHHTSAISHQPSAISLLSDTVVRIITPQSEKLMAKLFEAANTHNILIENIQLQKPSLNDVFLHYTGRELREEKNPKSNLKTIKRWQK